MSGLTNMVRSTVTAMPDAVWLVALLVAVVPLLAALRRPARYWPAAPSRPGSAPTDEEIARRVVQLEVRGMLPPGWRREDAARLLRIRARQIRQRSPRTGRLAA